jgi:hypothetical protein
MTVTLSSVVDAGDAPYPASGECPEHGNWPQPTRAPDDRITIIAA